LLHVQSKAGPGMAALHGAHGSRHDFFIISKTFCIEAEVSIVFLRLQVAFCKCKMTRLGRLARGKPLADVPFSC
jgi:hypothetical protein